MTRTRRRGFVLLEMLAVLALLGAFAVVSAKLFTSMMRQMRDTTAAQTVAGRFESAVTALRGDVWSAEKLQGEGGTLVLTSGGRMVTWVADDKGGMSRTETGAYPVVSGSRRWEGIPARVSFMIEGNAVWVQVEEKGGRSDTLAMASEAAAIRGGGEQ